MKVLILTCSTGEGHNSAARAISEYLTTLRVPNEIRDPLAFKSEKCARRAAKVYGNTVKYAPLFFGLIYGLGRLYDNMRLPSPVYSANASYAKALCNYISDGGFDRVICTHLFAMEAMTAARRKCGLNVPCYGVLTDYTAIPFYKDTALDGYFVGDDSVKEMLLRKKIPDGKIFCSGIPVSLKFTQPGGEEAIEQTGTAQSKKTVAVLSGGAGCGKIVRLCAALDKKLGDNCEIFVFPAKNERLFNKLCKRFKGKDRVKIIPFTPEIHEYIKRSDVVLTKAGGLSSTEIAAAGVPLVHLKSIPGCETANRKKFVGHGLSLYAPTVRKAVGCAELLLNDSELAEAMRQNQKKTINANAVKEIADTVLI